ncbi:MAG: allophanate hydrolase [Verrucomicrobiales bacterium]
MKTPSLISFRRDLLSGRQDLSSVLMGFWNTMMAGDPAIWITRISEEQLRERILQLRAHQPNDLPLYGVPFAVKDNIDVAGWPTTAGCPDFKYIADEHAQVVEQLLAAGAVCFGKTNMDQFATGLVGVRSPYGVPVNIKFPELIPGGSSSGSASALAAGMVLFSLGTDTAGSGRVPAAMQELVGWKPSRGLLSMRGVVPACRSLDCVSVFTTSVEDAELLAETLVTYDEDDPWSRHDLEEGHRVAVIGVPESLTLEAEQSAAWEKAVAVWRTLGVELRTVTIEPFLRAARLLYEGPWVAERFLVVETLLKNNPEALHPVTRKIIAAGAEPSAAQAFAAMYELCALQREASYVWEEVDALLLPTIPTVFTTEEVLAEPFGTNSELGSFTNFVNLMDLCAVAVPGPRRKDGGPFGVSLLGPAFYDRALLSTAAQACKLQAQEARTLLAVFGAHMRGLPLNPQLTERGGVFVEEISTAACYRMFQVDEKRPGLIRAEGAGGLSVSGELWDLPAEELGGLLQGIAKPLGLGRVALSDGREVCGFICEGAGVAGRPDISEFGGWRSFLDNRSN